MYNHLNINIIFTVILQSTVTLTYNKCLLPICTSKNYGHTLLLHAFSFTTLTFYPTHTNCFSSFFFFPHFFLSKNSHYHYITLLYTCSNSDGKAAGKKAAAQSFAVKLDRSCEKGSSLPALRATPIPHTSPLLLFGIISGWT
ncbi:hypothetical protein CIPAW_07G165200 [Carya illinoinensis]|uniref:Uncharacterized protein n=1 Tax=Carya illinoinensis TaxID=32201 RepID=A0A8T1PVZ3_CARIL|nr:hypothetical protein CIPAW_07G165200 [Carya illinoinensis]